MKNYSLFSPEEEQEFLRLVNQEDWSNATTLIYEKMITSCMRIYRNAGSIFKGNYIEENDFLHDQWINFQRYLTEKNDYLTADSPMAYTIKHLQKFALRLDSNDVFILGNWKTTFPRINW